MLFLFIIGNYYNFWFAQSTIDVSNVERLSDKAKKLTITNTPNTTLTHNADKTIINRSTVYRQIIKTTFQPPHLLTISSFEHMKDPKTKRSLITTNSTQTFYLPEFIKPRTIHHAHTAQQTKVYTIKLSSLTQYKIPEIPFGKYISTRTNFSEQNVNKRKIKNHT